MKSDFFLTGCTLLKEEGDVELARQMYQNAYQIFEDRESHKGKRGEHRFAQTGDSRDGLLIRMALLIPPIISSMEGITESREKVVNNLQALIDREPPIYLNDPVIGTFLNLLLLVYWFWGICT